MREHLRTLYAAVEHGFDGASLPDFVREDLEGYVRCGVLGRGFAHLQCEGCQRPLLVAFSCGSRGFCPSCLGRHQGLWTEPLGLAEARPPPYFRPVTRLRPNPQAEPQAELFE